MISLSSSDRLLVPACACGKDLTLATPNPLPNRDATHVRVYRCGDCGHETRITVGGADLCDASTREDSRSYLMRLIRGGPCDGYSSDPFLLLIGFSLGYGVREILSQRRRAAARRYSRRLHRHLSSGAHTEPDRRDQSASGSPAGAVIAGRANAKASS
jgi:hypothetical protein